MTATWYVLQSKPNKEDYLCGQLLSYGVEAFCPRIRVQPINPRARKHKPYFPGYVFVQLDLEKTRPSSMDWMPGAIRFVSFDGQPVDVSENLVLAVRRRVDQINQAGGELRERLKPGDAVRIQDGPFAGYEAIFQSHLSGADRARVLLKLLQNRQVRLDLLIGQVRPTKLN